MKYVVSTAVAIALVVYLCAALGGEGDDAKIDPRAEGVVRAAADYLRGLRTFRVALTTEITVRGQGMDQEMTVGHAMAAERPNKLAVRLEEGMMGSTVVCDGTKLFTHVPFMDNTYTVEDAPPSLGGVGGSSLAAMGMDGMWVAAMLVSDDPHATIMEGVNTLRYVGLADQDGRPCHELAFTQDEFDWKLWVLDGDRPLPVRIEPDLTRMHEQMGLPAGQGKIEVAVRLADWVVNADLPADTFTFVPPEGARKVDALFDDAMEFEEPSHELVGRPAPPFTLPLLEGGELDLASHRGKDVVILDFWATWCGPCVQALPVLAGVAADYRDRGVVLYAVNEQEEPQRIRAFLDRKKLDLSVPLDADGRVGRLYGVNGIPQTVIIGKDGAVEAVHVGFMPGMNKKLGEELDAILAGRSPAKEAVAAGEAGAVPQGLERAWTLEGSYGAVAGAGAAALALTMAGECVEVDAAGTIGNRFPTGDPTALLRAANLAGDRRPELITFGSWGRSVTAHGGDGQPLWRYDQDQGVDDVWAEDLDGDGLSEVIIGYNGDGGLHVLDNRGRPLWKYVGIGNVWHVCAGDLDGDRVPEVVTTSAAGQVHVFDAGGEPVTNLDVSCYANMVRVGPAADGRGTIVVGGRRAQGVLLGTRLDGAERWSIDMPASEFLESAAAATARPWLAAGARGGAVQVVDFDAGRVIGSVGSQGPRPQVAWIEAGGEPPLLLVATGRALCAYRIVQDDR